PLIQDLELDELAPISESLSFNDVVPVNGSARFRVRFHGTRVGEAYGSADCRGKFLDGVLPATYLNPALSAHHLRLCALRPGYTVADMRDPAGRIVHYERLLLPFSQQGLEVNGILASLETVSPEGDFEHRGLMKAPSRPPAFALCTTISAYGLPGREVF